MYKYNSEYKRELFSLYSKLESLSEAYDTTLEYILNDLSVYHLSNYKR